MFLESSGRDLSIYAIKNSLKGLFKACALCEKSCLDSSFQSTCYNENNAADNKIDIL